MSMVYAALRLSWSCMQTEVCELMVWAPHGNPHNPKVWWVRRACWQHTPTPSQHTGRVLEWACVQRTNCLQNRNFWLRLLDSKQMESENSCQQLCSSVTNQTSRSLDRGTCPHILWGWMAQAWGDTSEAEKSHASWRKCWNCAENIPGLARHSNERLTRGKRWRQRETGRRVWQETDAHL